MPETTKNDKNETQAEKDLDRSAESVDREPSAEPTPDGAHGLPVDREDEPRGQPTSDRFRSEQAQKNK